MRKNMKIAVTVIAALSALLIGCGAKSADFDVDALGNDLATKIEYADELGQMDLDTAQMFINLSDVNVVKAAIYEGSGGTAEEIIVLECATEDDAKRAEEALKTRVSEQIESFTDYVPEELTKLNAAIVKSSGKYAVLSVCDTPDAAKSLIDGYMK
ncbi:MAG: DUF4358 domain-containing protein [Lachnospiraceae bacterium]|nr:DUF4358 domain-containing protein [Lachnospiraceae bacterium]